MERIRQNRYENINCTNCSENFQADGVGFDFGKAISDTIRLSQTGTWDSLMHLNLRFYYSVRDICQIYRHQCDFRRFAPITIRIRDVKNQLEFLLRQNRITFDQLLMADINSEIYNMLYDLVHGNDGVEEFKNDIMHLVRNLASGKEEDIIAVIPVRFLLGYDDIGHAIPIGYEYLLHDEVHRVLERVCPSCGSVLDFQAGYRPEFIIGLVGLARVGKTVFIASLIRKLKELDPYSFIRLNITGDENDSFHVFEREIVSEYMQGRPITKTVVENEEAIPLIYLSVNIYGRDYNFIFVDMPGEIFSDSDSEDSLDFISNKRSILKRADMVWCFVEPAMINPKYHNKNVEVKEDSGQNQLSNLMQILNYIYRLKRESCIILTQSDLLQNDYSFLFQPNVNVFQEFIVNNGGKAHLDYTKMKNHVNATRYFMDKEMPSLSITAKSVFDGFTTMSVASYGFDISSDMLLSNKEVRPSMVELPFLWTLATLGILESSKTIVKRGFFNTKDIIEYEKLSNREELFD